MVGESACTQKETWQRTESLQYSRTFVPSGLGFGPTGREFVVEAEKGAVLTSVQRDEEFLSVGQKI